MHADFIIKGWKKPVMHEITDIGLLPKVGQTVIFLTNSGTYMERFKVVQVDADGDPRPIIHMDYVHAIAPWTKEGMAEVMALGSEAPLVDSDG